MSSINPFSVFDSAPAARMVIEASAGTGKTWNITGFYLRLLLEKRVLPERILVVTFTRMATRELKERIMKRLRDSLNALESGEHRCDPFLSQLLSFCSSRPWAASHLREAIRNFDDAAVLTIHGFCRQILQEEYLIAGVPPETEFVQTDDLLREAGEDFWRRFVHENSHTEAGQYYISKIMELGDSPEALLKVLQPVIRRGDARLESVQPAEPLEAVQRILDLRREMKRLWETENRQILDQLRNSGVRYMTEAMLASRERNMEAFFAGETHRQDWFKQMTYFRSSWFPNNLLKGKYKLPEHPFFDRCDEYKDALEQIPRIKTGFLEHAARTIRDLRDRKSRDSSLLTYNDLLERLEQALLSEATGDILSERIRKKFPFALVDEFQDTDPVQYRIFDRIYPEEGGETLLMMIGDPKQSIYAFRGADLYSYLRARRSVCREQRYTLGLNYRSRPALVKAVNVLFDRDTSPFLDEQIRFHPAGSGKEEDAGQFSDGGQEPVPMRIFSCQTDDTKGDLKPVLFRETARQIADLIARGRSGEVILADETSAGGMRKLHGGDVAVLLNSHRDIEQVRRYLKRYGISSVVYSREKIFKTGEAARLLRLLTAILEPANPATLQTALTSGFFDNRLSAVYNLRKNEQALSELMQRMQALQEIWKEQGSFPMLRSLLFEQNALEHLAGLEEGERILVNLQQLMELTATAEQEHGLDPPALLRWFKRRMTDSAEDEEETLRLESDENLVRLLTIHSSKGLEFPVVFCPGLWEGKMPGKGKRLVEVFHEEEEPHHPVINLEQFDSERRRRAFNRARYEEVAEEVRKAYVAVTRAKYECRIFWGVTESTNLSGMGALLIGQDKVERSIEESVKVKEGGEITPDELTGKLRKLADTHPDLFAFTTLDGTESAVDPLPPEYRKEELSRREYRGAESFGYRHTLYSFSSLLNQSREDPEPDYDPHPELPSGWSEEPVEPDPPADLFHFPRGKTAGTFIHKIFEQEGFDFRNPASCSDIIRDLLPAWDLDAHWLPVLEKMVFDVAGADYGPLSLSEVSPEDTIRELEFTFPVSAPRFSLLRECIEGRRAGPPTRGRQDFLTGFIDLVVHQNGIWYILDYKSNHLGDSIGMYNRAALKAEIQKAGYDLQYHLYVVALKKYLELRDPGFDYESSFGGVYYLFVRGMEKGSTGGIFYDKPDRKTIEEMEQLMDRDG